MSKLILKDQSLEALIAVKNKEVTRRVSYLENDSNFVTAEGSVKSVEVASTTKAITNTSGVSANTYGPTTDVTIAAKTSGSINIPYFTVNEQGIITSAVNRKLSIKTGCSHCNNCSVTTSCTYCKDCSYCSNCGDCSHCGDCNCEP